VPELRSIWIGLHYGEGSEAQAGDLATSQLEPPGTDRTPGGVVPRGATTPGTRIRHCGRFGIPSCGSSLDVFDYNCVVSLGIIESHAVAFGTVQPDGRRWRGSLEKRASSVGTFGA